MRTAGSFLRSRARGRASTLRSRVPGRASTLRSRAPGRASTLALILLSCSPSTNTSSHYDTRGLVRAIEGLGEERRVAIHHEAIERFVDRDGKLSPMPSMPMLFALAPKLRDAQLQIGDKLALGFDVHWDQSPTLVITKLDKLPPSTELALSASH